MSSGGRTTRHHKKRRGGGPGGPDLGQRGGDLMSIYSTFKNGLADTFDSSANYFRTWLPEPLKKLTTDGGVRSVFGGSVDLEDTGRTMGGGRRRRR
jgi:hypothetical protein